jgi:hypothetical protein
VDNKEKVEEAAETIRRKNTQNDQVKDVFFFHKFKFFRIAYGQEPINRN